MGRQAKAAKGDTQWLELRRQGWYAVVYVPAPLHGKLGKKLRRSLGTRDLREAQTKRHIAIADFKRQIAAVEANLGRAALDSLTVEAHGLREAMVSARDGEHVISGYGDEGQSQAEALRDYVADRAEQIGEAHGNEAASAFHGIASGTRTPILHHVPDWLHEGGQKGPLRERTKKQFASDIGVLAAWLKTAKLPPVVEAIDRRTAGRYVTEHLSKSARSHKTVQRMVSACRSYWTWLERKGVVDHTSNPWDRQAPHKVRVGGGEDTKKREFTAEEIITLLNGETDQDMADLMRIAALSGMRLDDPYRLIVRDCVGGVFNIRTAKTAAGVRRVPIHPDLVPIITRRTAGRATDAFLFADPTQVSPGQERSMAASKRFGHYRERVGVADNIPGKRGSRVDFHSFRRWFITQALQNGNFEHVVQQVVGHERKGVTVGTYHGGDTPETLRACVESVRLPKGALITPPKQDLPKRVAAPPRKPAKAPLTPSR